MDAPRRLRMFAGPNGSGKTSLIQSLAKEFSDEGVFHLHAFVNADEILSDLASGVGVDFKQFGLTTSRAEVLSALRSSTRIAVDNNIGRSLQVRRSRITLRAGAADVPVAAAIADLLRESLFAAGRSFAFETVMSHPNKVEFFARASAAGYRTYLYFVTTKSPLINIRRVENRVVLGGHSVPSDKLTERYHRSLDLVGQALDHAYRAFLFDNSDRAPLWLAELTPEKRLELKVPPNRLPQWFTTWVAPRYD